MKLSASPALAAFVLLLPLAPLGCGDDLNTSAASLSGGGSPTSASASTSTSDTSTEGTESGSVGSASAGTGASMSGGSTSGDDDMAVYVSTSGDEGASGLDPANAVATLTTGIERALGCAPTPCPIRVEVGTYYESVELASGVEIQGGYPLGFGGAPDPEANLTTIISPNEAATIAADGLTSPTRLAGLVIVGPDLGGLADGTSSYALRVRESAAHLTLKDVAIELGSGAAGLDGSAGGGPTTCNAVGGAGGVAFDCGGGAGGQGTAGGDPTLGGAGGVPGNSNCPNACPLVGGDGISDGAPGKDGLPGAPGGAGAPADDPWGSFVDGAWQGALGGEGARGNHGTGGGGGGSGGSKRFVACFGCGSLIGGTGGTGAPGGCGGAGGGAGGPGGGAFGLVLDASEVTLEGVTIAGGEGGAGGAGGDGAKGEAGGLDNTAGLGGGPSQQCGLINYKAGAGAPGGLGGSGGQGGGGPGGVGGVSIGVVLLGDAAVIDGGLEVVPGIGGPGGSGGLGAAPADAGISGAAEAIHTF